MGNELRWRRRRGRRASLRVASGGRVAVAAGARPTRYLEGGRREWRWRRVAHGRPDGLEGDRLAGGGGRRRAAAATLVTVASEWWPPRDDGGCGRHTAGATLLRDSAGWPL